MGVLRVQGGVFWLWLAVSGALASAAVAEALALPVRTVWSALELYESGQAYDVMRAGGGAGVMLNDRVLIENDAPGAGRSDKGVHTEPLHAGIRIRKALRLESAAARGAHVLVYMTPRDASDPAPWHMLVNGRRVEGVPRSWHELMWWWVPVPVEAFRAGENVIELVCEGPPERGYDVLFAREDEYARGGGAYTYRGHTGLLTSGFVEIPDSGNLPGLTPFEVGATSARSVDGGATYQTGLLGPEADTRGEYAVRISLEQHHPSGSLVSPPIDLWAEAAGASGIAPACRSTGLRLLGQGDTPPGTGIDWAVRFSDAPDPTDASWDAFTPVGTGASLDAPLPDTERRYAQVRATLRTEDPLSTPVLREIALSRTLHFTPPPENTFYTRRAVNPAPRYPSYPMYFEPGDAPELARLRAMLPEELLVRETHGQFAEINQIRHYVSQLWYHALPHPEYPEWNALDILKRKQQYGHGGMCIQFTIVFIQALQSLGYQARHVNVFNHELPEVYIDELEKWVVIDPESVFDSYEFHTGSGEPLSVLEQHQHFLRRYGFTAENPIPWASPAPWENRAGKAVPETPQPLEISTFTPWINDPDPMKRPPQHNLAGFFRLIPRNDFLTRPTPRPVAHGSTWWPWSGYLCWYDEATPRKLQHALHSDRVADFYPAINRVHYAASWGEKAGEVRVRMFTQTPNLAAFEININGSGWRESPAEFTWPLFPSGLNRLEMRVRNTLGLEGAPSLLEVFYHYRAPYAPKEEL